MDNIDRKQFTAARDAFLNDGRLNRTYKYWTGTEQHPAARETIAKQLERWHGVELNHIVTVTIPAPARLYYANAIWGVLND